MRRRAWMIVGATVLLIMIGLGVWGIFSARGFEALARAGKGDASAGLRSLEAKDLPAALESFQKAQNEFGSARDLLGPAALRGLPWIGHQLSTADDLATIGAEGSHAGAEATRALIAASSVSGDQRLGRVLQVVRPNLDEALVALVVVAKRADVLTTDGLLPPLADAVLDLKERLRPIALLLSRSQALLDVERYLFSAQHRFLVFAQNSTELRPTGGFNGTYGLVEFGPAGLSLDTFADIYSLPSAFQDVPAPDGWRMRSRHLSLLTANWWLDFPTSAEAMLGLWRKMRPSQPEVDGVIAIDLPTIRDLLKVFGPIKVPESSEALTAQNVVVQLGYVVEIENSGKTGDKRKEAVVSLAKAVTERLTQLTEAEFIPAMESLAVSANEKHLQVFLTDQAAQASLITVGWSGALAPPDGTTDLLAVSNAIVKPPAKGNLGVEKSLDYEVALNAGGTADTRLRLGYRKSAKSFLGIHDVNFPDHVRVHRPDGTVLVEGDGVEPLDDADGMSTFSRFFELAAGGSSSVTMRTTVPGALRQGTAQPVPQAQPAVVPPQGDQWHYRLLLAKQADLVNTEAVLKVTVPDGWRIVGSSAWFRSGGESVTTTADETTVTVKTALKQDLLLDVTLVPA